MKKRLSMRHWMVRAVGLCQALGALAGLAITLPVMWRSSGAIVVVQALFALLYLGTGIAATALWFGKQAGLQGTRLMLALQIPFIQSTHIGYLFYAGALGLVYFGNSLGMQGYLGASWQLDVRFGAVAATPLAVGVNVLAMIMLSILARVDPAASSTPPGSSAFPPQPSS